MTLLDIVTILANEPFDKSFDEIKRLTLFQVRNILFCAKDRETGQPHPQPGPKIDPVTPEEQFWAFCTTRKLPAWYVKEKYGKQS